MPSSGSLAAPSRSCKVKTERSRPVSAMTPASTSRVAAFIVRRIGSGWSCQLTAAGEDAASNGRSTSSCNRGMSTGITSHSPSGSPSTALAMPPTGPASGHRSGIPPARVPLIANRSAPAARSTERLRSSKVWPSRRMSALSSPMRDERPPARTRPTITWRPPGRSATLRHCHRWRVSQVFACVYGRMRYAACASARCATCLPCASFSTRPNAKYRMPSRPANGAASVTRVGPLRGKTRHGAQHGSDEEAITHRHRDGIAGQGEYQRAAIETRGEQRLAWADGDLVKEFPRTERSQRRRARSRSGQRTPRPW